MSRTQIAWLAAAAAFLALYEPVLRRLVADWFNDDNYSHGIVILPLAAYFAWDRRARLRALRPPVRPALSGLAFVFCGLALMVAGLFGAELFFSRVSLVLTLAGSIVFLLGWQGLRVLAFPVGFLLLGIPIPAILFNQVAFPLQLLASRVGEASLTAAGVPVLREGNVMILANTTLEVAQACSGIRSLVSLLTLGIVLGYFTDPRFGARAAIALASVPIAILTNGARVAGTGIAAHYVGRDAAEGFFHEFSGWLMFLVAFLLLYGVARAVQRVRPNVAAGAASPA